MSNPTIWTPKLLLPSSAAAIILQEREFYMCILNVTLSSLLHTS